MAVAAATEEDNDDDEVGGIAGRALSHFFYDKN